MINCTNILNLLLHRKKRFYHQNRQAAKHFIDIPVDTLVVFTGDHSTPCELKAHLTDPLPITFYAKGGLGVIEGKNVMP
jgi:2,3-bisphosphoglycerate-independent phosphoglycerate mutase